MRTLRIALVAVTVVLASIGGVIAATGPTAPPPPANLSNDEMIERSVGAVDQMQDTLKRGLDRLEQARSEKDLMRYNCINSKLKAVRGLVQIGELSGQALREAITARDDKMSRHNYTKIDLARARVEAFRVEIEACVGEGSQYTGGTEVESSIDPDIRQDDPSEADVLAGEPIDIDRPTPLTLHF